MSVSGWPPAAAGGPSASRVILAPRALYVDGTATFTASNVAIGGARAIVLWMNVFGGMIAAPASSFSGVVSSPVVGATLAQSILAALVALPTFFHLYTGEIGDPALHSVWQGGTLSRVLETNTTLAAVLDLSLQITDLSGTTMYDLAAGYDLVT